jgi:hypothetical protein
MNCHGCVGSINVCSNESPCLFPGKKIILWHAIFDDDSSPIFPYFPYTLR